MCLDFYFQKAYIVVIHNFFAEEQFKWESMQNTFQGLGGAFKSSAAFIEIAKTRFGYVMFNCCLFNVQILYCIFILPLGLHEQRYVIFTKQLYMEKKRKANKCITKGKCEKKNMKK
jgi:hypothetical protein